MTNKEFSQTDRTFIEACKRAMVQPTKRQASKFRRNVGSAFKALKKEGGV
jgi:hypothetical protein